MSDGHDYLALDWVRGEIQETLNQAQQALEAYVENVEDSTRIRFCQTYLHQVHGTLQMVEFYGAALLAEEMEKLSQALLDGKVAKTQITDSHEVLMRAILQLPPYLDRIQASRRDLPVVLLPLLNDLRAVRGEALMSETALFKPDIDSSATSGDIPEQLLDNPDFSPLVKKIRQMYQIALLGLIRDEKITESLGYMARVFAKLEQITDQAPLKPLWEVAAALVEAISSGDVERGTSVKSIFGHVDRVLRTLVVEGAQALGNSPPRDVLKNLLYYVGKSEGDTPRVKKIRVAYRLADALPTEDMINEERARMSGPDQSAMLSVVEAITEELSKVKAVLEQLVHTGSGAEEQLKEEVSTLKHVADTVAVLGLGKPRQLIEEQLVVIEAMAEGKREADPDTLMDVAGALLYVEATLEGITGKESRRSSKAYTGDEMPDQVAQAREAVIRESRAGLEEAKEGIVEFIASQWDQSHLEPVPGKLAGVRGGLDIIGLHKPAVILERCVTYISEQLLGEDKENPDWRSMDTLADAITSVEYYLERLSDDYLSTDKMLELAKTSVAALGYPLAEKDDFTTEQDDESLIDNESVTDDVVRPEPAESEVAKAVAIDSEEETPSDIETASESLPEEDESDQYEQVKQDKTTSTRVEETASEPEPAKSAATAPPADDLIDDEIIEIFVEEVEEVLEALNEHFPRWAANQNDEDSLVEFRRAFHTLKGSGRMVGASTCGELAWSIENMLNRVIDKTIEPTPQLIELVQTVHGLIQPLVDAFSHQQPDPFDVEPLKKAADTLADGGTIDAVPDVRASSATDQQTEAQPEKTQASDDEETIDDQLEIAGEFTDAPEKTKDALPALNDESEQEVIEPDSRQTESAEDALQEDGSPSGDDSEDDSDEIMLEEFDSQPIETDTEAEEDIELQALGGEIDESSGEFLETESLMAEETDDWSDDEIPLADVDEASEEVTDQRDTEYQAGADEKSDRVISEDTDLDPVLLDIFRSESESNIEIIEQWLEGLDVDISAHTVDDEVHRALHTIKGSARMAGITAVAAVAEPAERFVKELINSHHTADREVLVLLRDTLVVIRKGVEQLSMATDSLPGANELIDRYAMLREMISRDTDLSADQQLLSVFMSEGMDLILDSESLLERWATHPDNQQELEKLRDELSLLTGSAETANLREISTLTAAMADCYSAVLEGRLSCSNEFLELAHKGHDALINMMDYLAAAQSLSFADELISELRDLLEDVPEDSTGQATLEADEQDEITTLKENDFSEPEAEQSEWDDYIPETKAVEPPHQSQVDVTESPEPDNEPVSSAAEPVAKEVKDQGADIDPEMLEIFLEEADEILDTAANGLDQWEQNGDNESVGVLQRDLHTLKGGARMAGVRAIGDLGHELENLYEGFSNNRLQASPQLFELLHRCHDRLADMVDQLRSSQRCAPAPELVRAIHDFLSNPDAPLAEVSASQPADTTQKPPVESTEETTPTAAPPSVSEATPVPPQRDPELVEIFLEEADEILESVGNRLEAWMADPDNLIEVQSLQRDLHTLKGGARMAEITELGDLSHELENLYEGLCKGTLSAQPVLFDLLHQCHDRLADMVEGVKDNKGLMPAADLIQSIGDYITNPGDFSLTEATTVAPADSEDVPPAATEPESPATDEPVQAQSQVAASDILPEDVDLEILSIFIEESAELCELIDESIGAWKESPESHLHGDEIKRALHTLKGGARLAGLKKLGDISHDFETYLIDKLAQHVTTDEAWFDQMTAWLDRINAHVDDVRKAAASLSEPVAKAESAPAPAKPAATETPAEQQDQTLAQRADQPALNTREERLKRQAQPQEMVRIASDLLEGLVNLAGETSINRGRVEQGILEFSAHVEEMGNTIERLYGQLRRLDLETEAQIMSTWREGVERGEYDEDFDPLEMDQYSELHQITKQLSESASDLLDLKGTLLDRTRDTETLLLQQSRINTELQEKLMRTRMVPFARLVPRLRRIVRQVTGEVGKRVEFDVINPDGELDRTLLERIVAPLEHMLRNAVDHGIEAPDDRAAAGKETSGHIRLELTREGGEVVLLLTDDGKGIDTEAVRRKAIERGLIDEKSELSNQEIQQFIFNAGFSTAQKVTQLSGRGVGMDVVASEIKQMGGSVTIESEKGKGTRFVIRLPFTLAMNRALMVKVAEDTFAIPLNQIEGIVRVSPYELETYFEADPPPFVYAGQDYDFEYMGNFVHGNLKPNLDHQITPLPVLLIRSSEHVVAVLVDALVGSREVVVKSVGPQLSTVAGISGATILGDGAVVIILDIHQLIRAAHYQRQHIAMEDRRAAELAEHERRVEAEKERVASTPVVMVTDDSVTVRKVTSRLLERNGFEVITAKDGMDAVAILEDRRPDLMLLDIEMPRMDGFEVAMHMRHDARLKDVPIIMITSRTGEKHRERAFDIGVNSYLGKPFQEGELLTTIKELLEQSRETADS